MNIKTGSDLRRFVIEQLAARNDFPKLSDYLLRVWTVAEKNKNAINVDFSTIAKIIKEAFVAEPKDVNWKDLLKEPRIKEYYSEPNTLEYRSELKTFKVFENVLRNQVVDLKLQTRFFPKYNSDWENHTTYEYLERGTAHLEDESGIDNDVTWGDFEIILNAGRYTE